MSIGKLWLYRRKCAVWQVVAELGNADIQLILTKKLLRSRFMSDTFYTFAAAWPLYVMKREEKGHFEIGLIDN